MKAFFCHSSLDSEVVIKVAQYLKGSFNQIYYYESYQRSNKSFIEQINSEIASSDLFVAFIGGKTHESKWQKREVLEAIARDNSEGSDIQIIPVLLGNDIRIPDTFGLGSFTAIGHVESNIKYAFKIAKKIAELADIPFKYCGLPTNPDLASYEKTDIIDRLINISNAGKELFTESVYEDLRKSVIEGFPINWPVVFNWDEEKEKNPLDEVFRPNDAEVLAAALTKMINTPCKENWKFTLPEAGPRKLLHVFRRKRETLNVCVLVSGGIAPGINAVIDGITQRHYLYSNPKQKRNTQLYNLNVYGLLNGFQAFDDPFKENENYKLLYPSETSIHANEGGSLIKTSRYEELLDITTREDKLRHIISVLKENEIEILYIIGGEGSMRAAHAIFEKSKEYITNDWKLSVIGIPKTMDNDILWVWQTFGFLSAVEKGREVIENLNTEIKSNPRVGIIQLFGSDSGFVVSHAVLASRTKTCDVALIPEMKFSIKGLAKHLIKNIKEDKRYSPYGMIVMAETAIPEDAIKLYKRRDIGLDSNEQKAIEKYFNLKREGKRIQGQTDDHLRTAGLKLVSRGILQEFLKIRDNSGIRWDKTRIFTNEPRHLLRAIAPSCSDVIFAHRLGTLAVDNALAGYTDFMISQWLTEYVLVPLELVVLGRKRIPEKGIFWKSVIAKTGQPKDLF